MMTKAKTARKTNEEQGGGSPMQKQPRGPGMPSAQFVRIVLKRFLDAERAKAEEAKRTEEQRRNHNQVWPLTGSRPSVTGGAR